MTETKIKELEKRIGYEFHDMKMLMTAMCHSSYANEHRQRQIHDNERLEFLGDAVLEVSSSDFLFHQYPDMPEGKLTKLRASIVCEPTLALCAREIQSGAVPAAWKRRGAYRRTVSGFHCFRCDGGFDRSYLSGWWFC